MSVDYNQIDNAKIIVIVLRQHLIFCIYIYNMINCISGLKSRSFEKATLIEETKISRYLSLL